MTRKKRSCERFFCAFFRRTPLLYDMAVDVGRDDSLQQDERGEQREGSVKARLVGDKADGGRPHEDAEVAERADSWHSEADGHDVLFAEQREEYWHDIGAADADEEEAEVEQDDGRRKDDEKEAR